MKNILSTVVIGWAVAVASFACGALPQMTVLVSDSNGKAAYKGATDASGTFATATLKPGNYVVQFNARRGADVKGSNFALVVSAGKKKVTADLVAGEKFAGGGVAMRIELASGLSISGQVADAALVRVDENGKRLVWIPKKLGSNLPAHWAAENSADAKEAKTQTSYSRQNIQDRQNQGVSPGG
jgi:hypothetical protein